MDIIQHPSHAPSSVPAIQVFPARLHVVTALFNPLRYHARYRNYRAFEKHVTDAGAVLITVECAFGGRPFEITDPANPHHVQVRTNDELWLKENLLNLGLSRLPADAEYVAAIDADMAFTRTDWVQETLQVLQHHPVAQMFSAITYLGPNSEPLHTMPSFAECWISGQPIRMPSNDGLVQKEIFFSRWKPEAIEMATGYGEMTELNVARGTWGQPGGAWAYRRKALDEVGGLLDCAILGSADTLMIFGVLGKAVEYIQEDGFSHGYSAEIVEWGRRSQAAFRQNIGVVRGGALHYWHGNMKDRRYGLRNRVLRDSIYDPRHDLKKDTQGVYCLHDDGSARFVRLRDDLRSYFDGRNEDSNDASMYRR